MRFPQWAPFPVLGRAAEQLVDNGAVAGMKGGKRPDGSYFFSVVFRSAPPTPEVTGTGRTEDEALARFFHDVARFAKVRPEMESLLALRNRLL